MSSEIELLYGRSAVTFRWETARFSVISDASASETPLTDFAVGAALDAPIGSPPLDEIVDSNDSVLIVVSDATRPTASAQIVNLLVRRLVQIGVSPAQMAIEDSDEMRQPGSSTPSTTGSMFWCTGMRSNVLPWTRRL